MLSPAPSENCFRADPLPSTAAESCDRGDDLAVDAIEPMRAEGFAGISLGRAPAQPRHLGANSCPGEEGRDAARCCLLAAVLPMMDDEGRRQQGRIAENVHDVVTVA